MVGTFQFVMASFALAVQRDSVRRDELDARSRLAVIFLGELEKYGAEGGTHKPAVLRHFSGLFDFPQYSDTLPHRTINTVRTNRIIL